MVTFDGDLIYLFSENARIRLKDIAQRFKKTPQRMKYSLTLLEREGIISNPYCIFDYSYFGLLLFRVYFRSGYISETDKTNIITLLRDNPYVTTIYELTGGFDLAIEIAAPNPSRFNKELKKVANLVPTLNKYVVILNLVTHLYPRAYTINHEERTQGVGTEIIIGGDRGIEKFDDNEMVVMKALLGKPRARVSALARECGLNVKTVVSVVKRLRHKRIIKGFKQVVDTNRLGVQKERIFLRLHNLTQERELDLRQYLLTTKEIVQVNKTVGDWDMEIDVESYDKKTLRYLILQIREDFKDLIEDFNIIEFYQYYKKTYLPAYLFNEMKTDQV